MIRELWDEGIPANITVGITPILSEQMADEHLKAGFIKFVEGRIEAAQKDEERFNRRGSSPNPISLHLAKFYHTWYQGILDDFTKRYNQDVIAGFKKYQDLGAIEITTSAATHGFSPLLATDSSLYGQFRTGVESYKKHFGKSPKGVWLPECAYRPAQGNRPAIEKWLYDNDLKYFFTESYVIKGGKNAKTRRDFGPYGSIEYLPMQDLPATGHETFEAYYLKDYPVAVMGRHEEAGFRVWSAEHGYPGDSNYREFHKKDDKSGLHYWKLTSKNTDLGDKETYSPEAAFSRIHENSDHYVGLIQQLLTDHLKTTGKPGLIMVSFDTELFGHWWFEGIAWMKEVIRKLNNYTAVTMCTASQYLEANPPSTAIELPESSWGAGGHFEVWLNDQTRWMWPLIHECEHIMENLAVQANSKYGQVDSKSLSGRALTQLARELLLVQSSDWPFLITTGQATEYATKRFNEHYRRFHTLAEMIEKGNFDEAAIKQIEDIDNCFEKVDVSWFEPQTATSLAS
jgi:1,4-alpha-glucan branching enzyme